MYENMTGFPLTLFEYQTTTLQEGYVSEHQAVEDAQFGHWHKLATSHVVLAQTERLLACTLSSQMFWVSETAPSIKVVCQE
jgi:hypothetical protein